MNEKQYCRFIKVLNIIAKIGLFGFFYYLLLIYGVHIPCIFRTITGLKCPGCGISRMLLGLFEGSIEKAWYFNCFVLALMPFGGLYGVYKVGKYIKTGSKDTNWVEEMLLIILAMLALVFMIIRNLNIFNIY